MSTDRRKLIDLHPASGQIYKYLEISHLHVPQGTTIVTNNLILKSRIVIDYIFNEMRYNYYLLD